MKIVTGIIVAALAAAPAFAEAPASQKAAVMVRPTGTNTVSGVIRFEPGVPHGTHVVGELSGLTPGQHGMHVHEFGDCSAPDGSSAGPHYNPSGAKHGGPDSAMRHMGDLGNLTAGADGKAVIDFVDHAMSITGENSILGRAVVVHEKWDDLATDPSGNSGARIGCGVIGVAK